MSAHSLTRKGLSVLALLITVLLVLAPFQLSEILSTDPSQDGTKKADQREPQVFLVLGSNRTGASWLLQQLKQSQFAVCSEPYDVLDPDWERLGYTANLRNRDAMAMCSYAFVRDGVQNLTNWGDDPDNPSDVERCRLHDDTETIGGSEDPWAPHLSRLCRWIDRLDRNYSDVRILDLWITAYVENDVSLLQCECTSKLQPIKGLKVAAEWLPRWPVESWNPIDLNLNETQLARSAKMIFLHRPNWFDRYYGSLVDTLRLNQESSIFQVVVDTEDMLGAFPWMEYFDQLGRAWAHDHASDENIKDVEYELCRKRISECLQDIATFLEIPPDSGANKKRTSNSKKRREDDNMNLENIVNLGEVSEALAAYGHFEMINTPGVANYKPLKFLVYDDDPFHVRSRQFKGVSTQQFWGKNKWRKVAILLQDMDPEDIVVVGDSQRDASTNYLYRPLAEFKKTFAELTQDFPGAIVAAATMDCCVNALSYLEPGALFNENGTNRTGRACDSSDDRCPWLENGSEQQWKSFMSDLAAVKRASSSKTVYLDAGLIAGKARSLLHVLKLADIQASEDASAVLTDLMVRRPELVLLDYRQHMFGYYRPDPLLTFDTNCTYLQGHVTMKTSGSTLKSMFLQNEPKVRCVAQFEKTPNFPVWSEGGIELNPILDHVQRVADKSGRLKGIDLTFGPEVPYFIDETGLWTSKQIRDRVPDGTLRWRLEPIEKIQRLGYKLLTDSKNSTHWSALQQVLKNGGGFPFLGWYGDFKHCAHLNYEVAVSIPVLTNSATIGCENSFPIPSYQEVFDARTDRYTGMFREYKSKYAFDTKIRKLVWRGTLSTNDVHHVFESIRWRLCERVHQSGSEMFDVGLSHIPKHNHRVEANLTQVGGLVSGISPMSEFQRYLAILDMDGNSWSSRFGSLLCYNSVVIKVQPNYVDYFFFDLKPWTHYIPVRDDLTDLFENTAFALDPKNEEIIKDIIASANQWCAERFSPTQLAHDMVDIFESYVRRLNHGYSNWLDIWKERKADLQSAEDLEFVVI